MITGLYYYYKNVSALEEENKLKLASVSLPPIVIKFCRRRFLKGGKKQDLPPPSQQGSEILTGRQ
jgi:hypothetical protein